MNKVRPHSGWRLDASPSCREDYVADGARMTLAALAFAKEYCAKPSAPAKKLHAPSSYQTVAAPVSYSPAARPTTVYPIPANTSMTRGAPTYKPASSLWANYSSPAYETATPSSSCTSSEHATGSAKPTPIVYHSSVHLGPVPVRTSTVKTYVPSKPSKAPVSQPTNVYYTPTPEPQITTTLSTIVPKMPQGTGYSSVLVMNASWTAPLGPLQTAAAPSLVRAQAFGLMGLVMVAAVAML